MLLLVTVRLTVGRFAVALVTFLPGMFNHTCVHE